jgi:GDP-mannose 6-dehydrogenase
MKISVFGLGYVGSVTAVCLADREHDVIGVEANPDKLALFRAGQTPLFEPGLAELLKQRFTNPDGSLPPPTVADAIKTRRYHSSA